MRPGCPSSRQQHKHTPTLAHKQGGPPFLPLRLPCVACACPLLVSAVKVDGHLRAELGIATLSSFPRVPTPASGSENDHTKAGPSSQPKPVHANAQRTTHTSCSPLGGITEQAGRASCPGLVTVRSVVGECCCCARIRPRIDCKSGGALDVTLAGVAGPCRVEGRSQLEGGERRALDEQDVSTPTRTRHRQCLAYGRPLAPAPVASVSTSKDTLTVEEVKSCRIRRMSFRR